MIILDQIMKVVAKQSRALDHGEVTCTRLRTCKTLYGVVIDGLPLWEGKLGELSRGELSRFGLTTLKLHKDLVIAEDFGWQAVEGYLLRAAEKEEWSSRRIICIQVRSEIAERRLTDYPACVPVVQVQRLSSSLLVTTYIRSSDVGILPLDLAWLYRIGNRLEIGHKRPIKVQPFIANLHKYTDGLPSDGGVE